MLRAVRAALNDKARHAAHTVPGAEARILAPIPRPGKNVFCVGRNYREHIIEGNRAAGRDPNDFPKALELFSKPWTTVIGTGEPVRRHAAHTRLLDYEIELAIVIGERASYVGANEALNFVAGYCVCNDVSEREFQIERGGTWTKGKGCPTFGPLGPWLVTKDEVPDPQNLSMRLDVNGELVKPSGAMVLDRKKASFNPLIKLRSDFNPEMEQSIDEVK